VTFGDIISHCGDEQVDWPLCKVLFIGYVEAVENVT